jgi:hypothetical protein
VKQLERGDANDPGNQLQNLMGKPANKANHRGPAEQQNDEDVERSHIGPG